MTVAEVRRYLRTWIGQATGQSPDAIGEATPMVELGLSSRDAVAMAADIEDHTGVTVSIAVAFEHPTIESLATWIVEGDPEAEAADDDTDWTRSGPVERVDIAVVGLATRLPGDLNTPEQTWQALLEGRDAITDLPEGRWSEFMEEPRLAERIKNARTRGGYLTDIKGFDSEFFALSKTEADNIDPQQRMTLELTWEALEHARIPASSLRGESVGVFVGTSVMDYSYLAMSDPTIAHPYAITGTASSIVANRVSYFFDFHGPSVAVDTACSSSLVATHQAVQALRNGECDVAMAGGVNALITPAVTLGFDEIGQVLSPDGRIKSFSSDADGYTRSEGGAMLVLKRVDDARRDGDHILAVIAGSAVNHDGRSNGLIAPNPDAQADVLRRAYKDAGINPRTIDYVEAHGTGTVLGDPIEAQALGRVVGRGRPADKPLLLGAIKTNVGHMESAAGAASLTKMVLSLQHDKLPPSINYAGPNPFIDFDAAHLRVLDIVADWPRYGGYAVAGVSSFGFGGANAHVVLREVLPRDVVDVSPNRSPRLSRWQLPPKSTSRLSAGCVSTSTASSSISKTTTRRRTKYMNCPASPTKPSGSKRSRWKSLRPKRFRSRGAVAGLGVPDVTQAGRRRRAGRLDGKPRGTGVVTGIDRPGAVTTQPRPFPRGGAGPRPRRSRQGSARDRRWQAEALRVQHRRAGDQWPGMGDGRFRCAAPQDGQEPVSA